MVMFISPARSKLNSCTFEYTAASITVTFQPKVDIVYSHADRKYCCMPIRRRLHSIPEAEYSLKVPVAVPLKSSVSILPRAAISTEEV